MMIFLSKLLSIFVYPLTISILFAGIALSCFWLNKRTIAISSLVFSIAVIWISSLPVVSDHYYAGLERQHLPVAVKDSPLADAIIVLGGAVGPAKYPRKYLELFDGSDRVLHAARLYRFGKAPLVIAIGGNIPWMDTGKPEALLIQDLLNEWGVPSQHIITGRHSQNTYENALETKEILQEHRLQTVLLVTSALHMPRALAVFRSQGIDAIPSPADFGVVDKKELIIFDWLPNVDALRKTTRAIKEHLGYAVYKWRGWIKE